jgi:hypothetical protein
LYILGAAELPVGTVTVGTPSVTIVSRTETDNKDICEFSWQSDEDFVEYKVKVVNSTDATHGTGTQIPANDSSSNVSGTGTFSANTDITTTIDGDDLWDATGSDDEYIIKVFVKNADGVWST